MFKPDGNGRRARIGILEAHLDPVPESEMRMLTPSGVSIHTTRVPYGLNAGSSETVDRESAASYVAPPKIDEAVGLLAALRPNAIAHAFTSSSYLLGKEADLALRDRLTDAGGGIPIVIQALAIVDALEALGASRIALFHPPWYQEDVDALGVEYFQSHGLDVVQHGVAKIETEFCDAKSQDVYTWCTEQTCDAAQAVVLGGAGFRSIGAIDAIEQTLERPVVTGNQATFWRALHHADIHDAVPGYGRLFLRHPARDHR